MTDWILRNISFNLLYFGLTCIDATVKSSLQRIVSFVYLILYVFPGSSRNSNTFEKGVTSRRHVLSRIPPNYNDIFLKCWTSTWFTLLLNGCEPLCVLSLLRLGLRYLDSVSAPRMKRWRRTWNPVESAPMLPRTTLLVNRKLRGVQSDMQRCLISIIICHDKHMAWKLNRNCSIMIIIKFTELLLNVPYAVN